MPLKWKLYYACSLYLLLWVITLSTTGGIEMMKERSHNSAELLGIILIAVVFVIAISKSILSLKAISHYKNGTLQSKTEKVLFIIAFALTVLFASGLLLLSLLVIIPEDFLNHRIIYSGRVPSVNYFEMALDISFFAAALCCVYLSIFDLILLKAIRKKYYDMMLNFGEDIIHNP